ncbi:MAG: DUF4080 domain-containing protein [Verrucomicrobia bacterium]|nr:DUF4080 domain-containing protein [Verrucomicrobiota bacterium]
MANIILTTLNAKYIHAAFGLRYLFANLGNLQTEALILEFDINQKVVDIVERLLEKEPKIIGIGVYIWNVSLSTEVVAMVKQVCPDVIVVIGGPEVSFELEGQRIVDLSDFVITGEGDLEFAKLCRLLASGEKPEQKVIRAPLPDLQRVVLPYDRYDARDVAHRIIYVEASRGCPFTCEFCLSSLDTPVRQFPLQPLLKELQALIDRGVNHFKFVDRTFNLNLGTSKALLEFFLARYRPGMFLHFEMIPDRLPEALREPIRKFPPGTLQFEVGIQTLNEDVSVRIKRRQNLDRIRENFRFLREETGAHIHADLIAGLPGETVESFGKGFDQLLSWHPQEIQVGILKRLRGTPISRHDADWGMVYGNNPPYEILKTMNIQFRTMQRLRRFARFWDLVANSGNFVEATPRLWLGSASAFESFMRWSDWLYLKVERTHGIELNRLFELIFIFLTQHLGQSEVDVAQVLIGDYQRGGRNSPPQFLRAFQPDGTDIRRRSTRVNIPKRQARHLKDSGSRACS